MVVMVAQEVFNDTELYTLKWLRWQLNIHWNIGLMPKLQNFGHLMPGADSFGKDLDAGKDWRQEEKGTTRGWDGWMASLTQWTWFAQTPGDSEGQEDWCAAVHGVTKSWTWLNDWTVTRWQLKKRKKKKNPAQLSDTPKRNSRCL